MIELNIRHKRQGQMDDEVPYFYTETINGFKHLLSEEIFKEVIVESLKYLVDKGLVRIFAFIIMPNHIHLVWRILKPNGKESPSGSFSKFTAHQFKKMLVEEERFEVLNEYRVLKSDRRFQFWKDDPLAIPLTSEKSIIQKIDYIHNNPTKENWKLATLPEDYRWSSARFYITGYDEFGLVSHWRD